ncbi:MAG: ribonuclease P protein component [Defluviitaleaceae bacterium]|nr:ribonuclease P protein component [Defluviitaleaceae bacterium]MCL2835936.1 ribonuclease P protein component [Defluviitaleaceae bacterium]
MAGKSLVTIKKNAEFRAVWGGDRAITKSGSDGLLAVHIMENGLNTSRVGITVSRKVGKAVVRNKVRRRIREILRSFLFGTDNPCCNRPPCFDIVVIARAGSHEANFAELDRSLRKLLNQLIRRHLNKRQEKGS